MNKVQGQGFLKFGKNGNADARDQVTTQKDGTFTMKLRYSSTADINNVDLYVNGSKVETMKLANTNGYSNWKNYEKKITLKKGQNTIEFKSNAALPASLYIDNFTLDGDFGNGSGQVVVNPTEPATEPQPVTLNGKLIQKLTVNDTENGADWSIASDMKTGTAVYGDRDITITSMPKNLENAECIRTACDSKLFAKDEASFTAGADITVYAAVDTRKADSLDWLKTWRSGMSVTTSNDVELMLYKRNFKSGETVTLGTNGADNESANYIVFAVPQETVIKGDVNMDGIVDVFDLALAKRAAKSCTNTVVFDDTDVNANGVIDENDLKQLESYIHAKIKGFTADTNGSYKKKLTSDPQPTVAAVQNVSTFHYNSNLQYHKAPDSYRQDAAKQGTVEEVKYQTTVYGNNLQKSAYVYLPAGYDKNKQNNIIYLMHGGGGNEKSIFIENMLMKQYLDHMIANGDIEPMIVVTPTFNNAAGTDMTANAKNFWNELAKDVVPAVEGKYSTYAKSVSAADLKASRMHRAFGGFSMGSLTTWYVMLNDLDYFAYIMPLSGDCWAGNTADEKAASVENAIRKSGYTKNQYFLMCATGTKDIAYGAMNDQINSMKKKDCFTYTSDFSKGNFWFLLCDGGSHWWDGYIVDYIYDMLPYFFRES